MVGLRRVKDSETWGKLDSCVNSITEKTNGTVYRLSLPFDALRFSIECNNKMIENIIERSSYEETQHTVVVKSVDSGMRISYLPLTELTILRVRSRSPLTRIQNSLKQLYLGKTVNEPDLLLIYANPADDEK